MKQSRYRQVSTGVNLLSVYYVWSCKDCGAMCYNNEAAETHDKFHDALDNAGVGRYDGLTNPLQ